MKYKGFDDEWIKANYGGYKRTTELYTAYKLIHSNENRSLKSFCTHCNTDLKLTHRYTMDQDKWIKENYPILGAEQTFDRFCKYFRIRKGFEGFKSHIKELGLHVSDERQREADNNNGKREKLPIGTRRLRGRGDIFILTEKGWIMEVKYLCNPPKGWMVCHLDGNKENNSMDNLMAIKPKISAKMTAHNMWSTDKEITRAGILTCQLELLANGKANKGDIYFK